MRGAGRDAHFHYATSSCIRTLGRLFSKRQRERNWLNAARVKNRDKSWAKNKGPQEQKEKKRRKKMSCLHKRLQQGWPWCRGTFPARSPCAESNHLQQIFCFCTPCIAWRCPARPSSPLMRRSAAVWHADCSGA